VTSDPGRPPGPSAEKELAIYGQLPSYRAMLDREGAAGPGDVARGSWTRIRGSRRRFGVLADAGVTDFVAVEVARGVGPGQDPQPAEGGRRPEARVRGVAR